MRNGCTQTVEVHSYLKRVPREVRDACGRVNRFCSRRQTRSIIVYRPIVACRRDTVESSVGQWSETDDFW